MPKILMSEPHWGYRFLLCIVDLGEKYPRLGNFYPIGADIFVFIYPIYLIVLYGYGIIKKQIQAKQDALFIFFGCFFSVLVNIFSQQFFDKTRPIYEFGIQSMDETILHQFLPVTSFPSDHAVVTFSVAMSTFLIASKHHKKYLKIFSYFLFVIAIITGICRIGTTVHWTTDILAGTIMGILVPIILLIPAFFSRLHKWIINPIIKLEEWVLFKIFHFKQ